MSDKTEKKYMKKSEIVTFGIGLFGVALMVGKCVYGTACDRFGGYRMGWLFGAIRYLLR